MGLLIRTIGQLRATAKITLANLAYNMRRLVWMESSAAPA
jgi:IS5 family transposase